MGSTIKPSFKLENSLEFYYTNPSPSATKLIFEPAALEFYDFKNKTPDTLTLNYYSKEELSNLNLTVIDSLNNSDSTYFIKIYNSENTYSFSTKQNISNNLTNISPGTYNLMIYQDLNNNDKWDIGNYYKQQISEPIKIYSNFLIIKPNWELYNVNISTN